MVFRFTCLALLIAATALQTGCGPAKNAGATVSGKVLQGGQPLKMTPNADSPPGGDAIDISLFPVDGEGQEQPGEYNEQDGTVTFAGQDSTPPGIAPGKYRLVIMMAPGGDFEQDQLGGVFGMDNSPVEVDIPESARGGSHDIGTIEVNDHKGEGS